MGRSGTKITTAPAERRPPPTPDLDPPGLADTGSAVGAAALAGLASLEAAAALPAVPPALAGLASLDAGATLADAAAPAFSPPRAAWRLAPALEGVLLLQLCAALFGSNQAVVKGVEAAASPQLTAAVRFTLAAALFAPAALAGLRDPPTRRAGLELGCWLAAGYACQAAGLAHSTAARGAFTGAFTIFTVPALSSLLGGRAIPPATWGLAALALAGVALLTSSDGPPPGPADALLVLSALLFGAHKWRCEAAAVATAGAGADPAAAAGLTGVQLGVMALAAIAAAAPEVLAAAQAGTLGDLLGPGSVFPWGACVYMGLITTGLTLRWEVEALKTVPAHTAALIYSSELVWGAAGAWILGGERWGVGGWVGAAAVVAASLGAALGVGGGGREEGKRDC